MFSLRNIPVRCSVDSPLWVNCRLCWSNTYCNNKCSCLITKNSTRKHTCQNNTLWGSTKSISHHALQIYRLYVTTSGCPEHLLAGKHWSILTDLLLSEMYSDIHGSPPEVPVLPHTSTPFTVLLLKINSDAGSFPQCTTRGITSPSFGGGDISLGSKSFV